MSDPDQLSDLAAAPVPPWRDGVRDAVVPFVAWRVVLFAVAAFANSYLLPGAAAKALSVNGLSVLWSPWNRFDSTFYLGIAQHGYSSDGGPDWAFYPLYPTLVRVLSALFGGSETATLIAGLLLANLAAIGAALVMYLLVRAEWGRDVARRTSLYFAVLPFGFYLSAPYAESLFVLLAVSCLYLTRQHRWIAAGLVGALAAATRPPGLMLALVIFCEMVVLARADRRDGYKADLAVPLLGAAIVPTGLLAFLALGKQVTGDWLVTFHVSEKVWHRKLSFPWTALKNGVDSAHWGQPNEYFFGLMNLALLVICVAALALMVTRFPPTFTVFTGALIALSVTSTLLQSLGRQTLPLVTVLVLLATLTRSESSNRHQAVMMGFSALCAAFLCCYVLLVPAIA